MPSLRPQGLPFVLAALLVCSSPVVLSVADQRGRPEITQSSLRPPGFELDVLEPPLSILRLPTDSQSRTQGQLVEEGGSTSRIHEGAVNKPGRGSLQVSDFFLQWQISLLRLKEETGLWKSRKENWVLRGTWPSIWMTLPKAVGDGEDFLDLLVHHASAIYVEDLVSLASWNCSRCTIPPVQGFQLTSLIIDYQELLQAYVGVHHDKDLIVVCFRGTHSTYMKNWIDDLWAVPLDFSFPGVDHAYVHRGFYNAYHHSELKPKVTAEVLRLLSENPTYHVAITGHSLGAALASLSGLDLVLSYNIPSERMWVATFGSPRVGNSVFASFFRSTLPSSVRVTHNRDIVVHLPPHTPHAGTWTYHHVAQEIWYHRVSFFSLDEVFQACDDEGEDLSCSRSVPGSSIADHLTYLGVSLCSVPSHKH